MTPSNLKFLKSHEWAKIDGRRARIGITDHAQTALGDIVFVELPAVGRELKHHETFGVVESIKAVSDLFSPLAGKVVAINTSVAQDPGALNRDPHGEAWLIELEIADPKSVEDLLDASSYEGFVSTLS